MFNPASVFLLSFTLLSISLSSLVKADIVIIASKATPINNLEREQAEKLWLGEIYKLPGVGKVKVIDQLNSSLIKEEFYEKLTHKNMNQLKVHWARIIFTGKAVPPKTLSSDKKILDIVSKNKNILGYINSSSITDNAKVLMTVK